MIGAWPPNIKKEDDDSIVDRYFGQFKLPSNKLYTKDYVEKLESRIRELEAQLETLSPGVTRG